MNAIEFVKEHGIEYTTGIVVGCESGFLPKNDNYLDLKQIIDAFEFVDAHGSIDAAKKYVNQMDAAEKSSHYNNLRAKIKLVEQCQ